MIRATENCKLFDPLKQSEYKTYLKGSKVISSQNSTSNRKVKKNSTMVPHLNANVSALSDKVGGVNSGRNG